MYIWTNGVNRTLCFFCSIDIYDLQLVWSLIVHKLGQGSTTINPVVFHGNFLQLFRLDIDSQVYFSSSDSKALIIPKILEPVQKARR